MYKAKYLGPQPRGALQPNQDVAIKITQCDKVRPNEVLLQARIQHINVIRLYDVFRCVSGERMTSITSRSLTCRNINFHRAFFACLRCFLWRCTRFTAFFAFATHTQHALMCRVEDRDGMLFLAIVMEIADPTTYRLPGSSLWNCIEATVNENMRKVVFQRDPNARIRAPIIGGEPMIRWIFLQVRE